MRLALDDVGRPLVHARSSLTKTPILGLRSSSNTASSSLQPASEWNGRECNARCGKTIRPISKRLEAPGIFGPSATTLRRYEARGGS